MFVSTGIYKHGSHYSYTWQERQSWQWQPTLDVHDPTPPITLEDADGAVEGTGAGTFSLTGTAAGVHGVAGTAVGSFAVTGTAAGVLGQTGTAVGTFAPTGTASGVHGVAGTAVGTFAATGAGAGAVGGAGDE